MARCNIALRFLTIEGRISEERKNPLLSRADSNLIKNLFNSNQATILNNNHQNKVDIQTNINSEYKFIFNNKDHYLL